MDGSTDRRAGLGKEVPLHQIKERSWARIFRDPHRNESRCPCDTGRRSGATLSPARPLVPRIDSGRFTAGIDLIDDQEDRALSPCAVSSCLALPYHAISSNISLVAREGRRY